MKTWMIGLLIGVGAAAIGIGGAFAYNAAFPAVRTAQDTTVSGGNLNLPPGRNDSRFNDQSRSLGCDCQYDNEDAFPNTPYGQNSRRNGMQNDPRYYGNDAITSTDGTRIGMEDAYNNAQEYVNSVGSSLEIHEIMEFEDNFYVVVLESDTGRGAMELLVDPYTGRVTREIGPNMMWNSKYGGRGMMRYQSVTDNTLTADEAREKAQESLNSQYEDAEVSDMAIDFYGYYTFDYSIDGQTSGMLSVNGSTGAVWYHTWHGTFISEKEYE